MTKEEYQKKIDEIKKQKDALDAQIEQVKKEFIDSLLRELEDVMIIFATSEQLARSSCSLFEDFIFADGTPFGIKEEQQ